MPIRQRNGGWQVDVFVKGAGRVRHQCSGSKRDAQALEMEIRLALLKEGRWGDPKATKGARPGAKAVDVRPMILRDGLPRARAHWRSSCGDGYAQDCEAIVKDFVEAIGGDIPLDELTSEDIGRAAAEWKRRGLAKATVRTKLSAMSKLYEVCRRTPVLTRVQPEFKAWRPRGVVVADRVLTDAEEQELVRYFTAMGHDEFRDLCLVALDLALHQQEAAALKVTHFEALDTDEPVCHVPGTKNDHRAAPVAMTPRAVETVKRRIAEVRGVGGVHLFPTYYRRPSTVAYVWQGFREHLGLEDDPHFTFKVLRHTCGTRLAGEHIDAFTIQRYMRHANITTTRRYVHTGRRQLQEAARRLASRGTEGR